MEKKKRKFKLFDLNRDGKGVPKDLDEKRNFTFFFKLLGRKLGNLFSVNMLLLFGNFPIFFLLLASSGNLNTVSYSPASQFFGPVYGAAEFGKISPAVQSAISGVHGLQVEISVNTTATYIMYAIGALVIFTFGLSTVGTTYIVRNLVKGEPVFLMYDFFNTIKKNWKQGLIFGILDLLFCFLIVYDIFFFMFNNSTYIVSVMFFLSIAIGIIYFVMRFYIYTMMVTFKLSIYKLIKNAFIFSVVGIKRNVLGLLGIVLLIVFNYGLMFLFFPLGVLMPFVITPAIAQFTAIYTAYPKIEEIMITPYQEEETDETEPVFKDRG